MAEALSTLAGFTKTMKEKPISGLISFVQPSLADYGTEKILMSLVGKKDVVTSNKLPRLQVMNTLTHEESLLSVSRSSEVSSGAAPIGELIRDAGGDLGVIQEDDRRVDDSDLLIQTGALSSHNFSTRVPTLFTCHMLKHQETQPRVWLTVRLTVEVKVDVEACLYGTNTRRSYDSGSLHQILRPIIMLRAVVSTPELGIGLCKASHSDRGKRAVLHC